MYNLFQLQIEQLKPGWFEIDPHKLFEDAKTVLRDGIRGGLSTFCSLSLLLVISSNLNLYCAVPS